MAYLMRVLVIIIVLFPFTSKAIYTEIYPATTKTASGDLNFSIFCNDYVTITKVYQRYGNQTAGTVFDLVLPNETVRATTSGTSGYLEFALSNTSCSPTQSISAVLDFISGDSAWSWYRLSYTPVVGGYKNPFDEMVIYADAGEALYWFPQGYDFVYSHLEVINGGGGDMATTTVITENDQLINFFILFCFVYMVLFGVIMLLKPFYVRK